MTPNKTDLRMFFHINRVRGLVSKTLKAALQKSAKKKIKNKNINF